MVNEALMANGLLTTLIRRPRPGRATSMQTAAPIGSSAIKWQDTYYYREAVSGGLVQITAQDDLLIQHEICILWLPLLALTPRRGLQERYETLRHAFRTLRAIMAQGHSFG